ncbi:MAG: hypothetical protein WCK42_06325, partial [Myxococcaceae bacterium]
MSLINWLKDKPTPRFHWSSRAGYGVKEESKMPLMGSLGLLRFDSQRPSDKLWEPFGNSRFIVPKELKLENKALLKLPNRHGEEAQPTRPSMDCFSAKALRNDESTGFQIIVEQALASI